VHGRCVKARHLSPPCVSGVGCCCYVFEILCDVILANYKPPFRSLFKDEQIMVKLSI